MRNRNEPILLPCPKCKGDLSYLETMSGESITLCNNCGWRQKPEDPSVITGWTVEQIPTPRHLSFDCHGRVRETGP